MESNKRAIKVLITLLITTAVIFMMEKKFLVLELRGETVSHYDQIKWIDKINLLVDDFEGLSDSTSLQKASFFSYGSVKIASDSLQTDKSVIASKTCLKISWNNTEKYGGWGKGIGKNIDINAATDHLNFRIYVPKSNGNDEVIKIILEEDDNNNGVLDKDKDDSWFYRLTVPALDQWQFISIPLKDFADQNPGGDGILNITRKGGLHTIIFSLEQAEKYTPNHKWYFDFICFTNEKITSTDPH